LTYEPPESPEKLCQAPGPGRPKKPDYASMTDLEQWKKKLQHATQNPKAATATLLRLLELEGVAIGAVKLDRVEITPPPEEPKPEEPKKEESVVRPFPEDL
jgi:hypothetical protein